MIFVDENAAVLAGNDDSCGDGSEITYVVPSDRPCQTYTLRQGMHHLPLCFNVWIYKIEDR